MEVLLHDSCIQHHVLGSTLCALYTRLELYLDIPYPKVNKEIFLRLTALTLNSFKTSCYSPEITQTHFSLEIIKYNLFCSSFSSK